MTVPPPQTAHSQADPQSGVEPPGGFSQPSTLTVTSRQQSYLDGLRSSGVRPSSELLALRIGSYVCQARAAKQTDQAVRDYVTPLVRSDFRSGGSAGPPQTWSEVDAVTADYIRIATERLC